MHFEGWEHSSLFLLDIGFLIFKFRFIDNTLRLVTIGMNAREGIKSIVV